MLVRRSRSLASARRADLISYPVNRLLAALTGFTAPRPPTPRSLGGIGARKGGQLYLAKPAFSLLTLLLVRFERCLFSVFAHCGKSARSAKNDSARDPGSAASKFIGEVERGEKSISLDSLYHVSVALGVPLRDLTDVVDKHRTVPTEEAEKIYTLVSRWRRPENVRKAYDVLRAMFSRAS